MQLWNITDKFFSRAVGYDDTSASFDIWIPEDGVVIKKSGNYYTLEIKALFENGVTYYSNITVIDEDGRIHGDVGGLGVIVGNQYYPLTTKFEFVNEGLESRTGIVEIPISEIDKEIILAARLAKNGYNERSVRSWKFDLINSRGEIWDSDILTQIAPFKLSDVIGGHMQIKVNGVFRETDMSYIKIADDWKEIEQTYTKVNGIWKEVI